MSWQLAPFSSASAGILQTRGASHYAWTRKAIPTQWCWAPPWAHTFVGSDKLLRLNILWFLYHNHTKPIHICRCISELASCTRRCSYKKQSFILKNLVLTCKNTLFMKRGRLLREKERPCQECPGLEHIGWIHPNHSQPFPTISHHSWILYMKSIYFNWFSIYFSIFQVGFTWFFNIVP